MRVECSLLARRTLRAPPPLLTKKRHFFVKTPSFFLIARVLEETLTTVERRDDVDDDDDVVVSRSGGGGGGDGRRRARRVIARIIIIVVVVINIVSSSSKKMCGSFLWDQIDFSDERRTFALLKKYQKILLLRMTMRRRSESATVLTKKYAYRGTVDACGSASIVPSAPTTISKDHSTAVLSALRRRFDSRALRAAAVALLKALNSVLLDEDAEGIRDEEVSQRWSVKETSWKHALDEKGQRDAEMLVFCVCCKCFGAKKSRKLT